MKPRREQDAVVDVLDVILDDGIIVEADVVISVADVALIGINLRAAIAGMTTMTEYDLFEEERADRGIAADNSSEDDVIEPDRPPARNDS